VLLAPAMNTNMLAHPAVRQNLDILAARGTGFVEPGEGYLACGWVGKGRLAEPEEIVRAAELVLAPRTSALRGRRVVVTAGPTYEDFDPVRFVGNRSSGRMGFALAAEAARRGATVTLVAGPSPVTPPVVSDVVRVRSAAEMHAAVLAAAEGADLVVMAAAVADYRPAAVEAQKIAKADGPLVVTFERTPDILSDLGRRRGAGGPVLVGFAAETADVVARARAKRVAKGLDLIVANEVGVPDRGFDAATNAVTLIDAEGEEDVPLQAKARVAIAVLDRAERHVAARAAVRA
jgi:phosphopantothenoylcysteine decarboxylase/phosphopantothenate--cysteine ligase